MQAIALHAITKPWALHVGYLYKLHVLSDHLFFGIMADNAWIHLQYTHRTSPGDQLLCFPWNGIPIELRSTLASRSFVAVVQTRTSTLGIIFGGYLYHHSSISARIPT